MDHHPSTPTTTETGAGYETSDVSPRGIVLLGTALVAVTLGASLLLYWLFGLLEHRAERADPRISPLATNVEPAHGPLLENNFRYDDFVKKDEDHLNSYGWIE